MQPIFGNEAAVGYGWQDFVVTIENPTPTQQKGTLELRSHMSTYVDRDSFVAKAPFVVGAGKTVSVRLPMRARNDQVPTLTLRVSDTNNGGESVILLPPGARSWYVRTAGGLRAYRADLGFTPAPTVPSVPASPTDGLSKAY